MYLHKNPQSSFYFNSFDAMLRDLLNLLRWVCVKLKYIDHSITILDEVGLCKKLNEYEMGPYFDLLNKELLKKKQTHTYI